MLKLMSHSQNDSSSSSPTSAASLVEEYDEMQRANIFPPVQEDQSVASLSVQSQALSAHSEDSKMSAHSQSTSSTHRNHNGKTNSLRQHLHKTRNKMSTTSGDDQSIASRGSKSHHSTSHEVQLQQQVDSLRQQLAERDLLVNDLQRQIHEDKRSHQKLKEKWDLFVGGGSSTTTDFHSSFSSSQQERAAEQRLLKVHAAMETIEAERDMAMQKMLKLSVQLAETKALASTLESQLDELQELILYHNHSTPEFLSAARLILPGHHDKNKNKTNNHNNYCSPYTTPDVTPQQQSGRLLRNSTRTTTTSSLSTSATSTDSLRRSPHMPPEFPVCDIELNDDSELANSSQRAMDVSLGASHRSHGGRRSPVPTSTRTWSLGDLSHDTISLDHDIDDDDDDHEANDNLQDLGFRSERSKKLTKEISLSSRGVRSERGTSTTRSQSPKNSSPGRPGMSNNNGMNRWSSIRNLFGNHHQQQHKETEEEDN